MRTLHNILLPAMILFLFGCNKADKLIGTWISNPVDTAFTTIDFNEDFIISNQISPYADYAKYRIKGNRLIIDSGVISFDGMYYLPCDTLKFTLLNKGQNLKLSCSNDEFNSRLTRHNSLSIYEKLLPNLLIDVNIPGFENGQNIELYELGFLFIGKAKLKLIERFSTNSFYVQLNDDVVLPNDPSILDFVPEGFQEEKIALFCDKDLDLATLDSLRYILSAFPLYLAGLTPENEFKYLKTTPYHLCECIEYTCIPICPPLEYTCKHKLYSKIADLNNRIIIDKYGTVSFNGQTIPVDSLSLHLTEDLKLKKNRIHFFIEYNSNTRFEDYFKVYNFLVESYRTAEKDNRKLQVHNMSDKDIMIANSTFKASRQQ